MKIEIGKTYVTGGDYGSWPVLIISRMVFSDTPVFYGNNNEPGYWFEDGRHSTGSEAIKLVAEVPSVAPTPAPTPIPTPAPPIQPPAPPSTVRDALSEVRAAIVIMNYATKRLTAAVAGAQAVSAIDRAK